MIFCMNLIFFKLIFILRGQELLLLWLNLYLFFFFLFFIIIRLLFNRFFNLFLFFIILFAHTFIIQSLHILTKFLFTKASWYVISMSFRLIDVSIDKLLEEIDIPTEEEAGRA